MNVINYKNTNSLRDQQFTEVMMFSQKEIITKRIYFVINLYKFIKMYNILFYKNAYGVYKVI